MGRERVKGGREGGVHGVIDFIDRQLQRSIGVARAQPKYYNSVHAIRRY